MKTTFFFMINLLLFSTGLMAQGQQQDKDQIRLRDHLVLQDGILYHKQDKDQIRLHDRIQLRDGTWVNPDGSFQDRDRKQQQLRDGECLDMDGQRYKSETRFMEKMNRREQAMQYEHFIMQNGQVYHIRNQQMIRLQDRISLKNGTTIQPDGFIQERDKDRVRLRDGECLNLDGDRFKSQDRLRDHFDRQDRDRDRIHQDARRDRMGVDRGNGGKKGS